MLAYHRSRPGIKIKTENIEENTIFSVEIFHARESDETSGPKKRRSKRWKLEFLYRWNLQFLPSTHNSFVWRAAIARNRSLQANLAAGELLLLSFLKINKVLKELEFCIKGFKDNLISDPTSPYKNWLDARINCIVAAQFPCWIKKKLELLCFTGSALISFYAQIKRTTR